MNDWIEPKDGDPEKQQKEDQQKARKEWQLIEKVVLANSQELKRSRRWGIFFKVLTFVYLFALLFIFRANMDFGMSNNNQGSDSGHVGLVEVSGMIAAGNDASADMIIGGLRAAFENKNTKAVILRINSPGGSPVQSSYVYDEIKRLRALYPDTKAYAVIMDTGASGAYYIAAAADEIYAAKSSLVGSIGVTAAGFGFADAIEKIGVERRSYASGDHKGFLDPFLPIKEDERAFFETMLENVHQQFIDDVKAGRGDRLVNDPALFSGLFWSGEQALDLGLVDGLKSSSQLARELGYPDLVDFTPRKSPLEQFARQLGASIGNTMVRAMGVDGLQLN